MVILCRNGYSSREPVQIAAFALQVDIYHKAVMCARIAVNALQLRCGKLARSNITHTYILLPVPCGRLRGNLIFHHYILGQPHIVGVAVTFNIFLVLLI